MEYFNYRTISLLSHASKFFLNFLHPNTFLPQASIVPGIGKSEQIPNISTYDDIEKARKFKKPIYLCCIDYKKTFDNVK